MLGSKRLLGTVGYKLVRCSQLKLVTAEKLDQKKKKDSLTFGKEAGIVVGEVATEEPTVAKFIVSFQ